MKLRHCLKTAPERGLAYILWLLGCDFGLCKLMNYSDLIKEIISTYQKHGWELRRALLRSETQSELRTETGSDVFPVTGVQLEEATLDGLWFSRASHEQREAWELRLVAENPFALFETFEVDETEEQREEMRREMEARLRDYVTDRRPMTDDR